MADIMNLSGDNPDDALANVLVCNNVAGEFKHHQAITFIFN